MDILFFKECFRESFVPKGELFVTLEQRWLQR